MGAYQDHLSAVPLTTAPQAPSAPQHSSVPISSSTSYYTNSPSPPQVRGTDARSVPTEDLITRPLPVYGTEVTTSAPTASSADATATNFLHCLTHSNLDEPHAQSDVIVLSRNQFELINSKLDQLTRRVQHLEHTLANDVRLILNMLQAQQSSREMAPVKPEVIVTSLRLI